MVRLAKRAIAVSGVALSLAAILPGCTEDVQSMMFVRQVQGLVAPQCVVDNSPDSIAISSGTLDVAFRRTYLANLLVGNQLVGRGAAELSRSETSNVQIRTAIVHVEDASGAQLSEYTISVTGFVDASRAGAVSYGVVAVPLIDGGAADKVADLLAGDGRGATRRLFSRVKVVGETLGGSEVESAEFGFPITVCNGCLVSFPVDSDDPAIDGPDCKNAASGTVTAGQCLFGQDAAIDCRQCASSPVCTP